MLDPSSASRRLVIPLLVPWLVCSCAMPGPMEARPDSSEGFIARDAPGRKSGLPTEKRSTPFAFTSFDLDEPRKMIYAAALTLEAAKPEAVVADVIAKTEAAGGYLATRNNFAITVRVPVAKFQTLLADFRALGRILDESVQAEDVTRQHRDLTIRLANAKKTRERLLVLLDKATAVQDILAIEKELERLTTEIEQMQAEVDSLDKRIAFSTISVTVQPVADVVRKSSQPSRFPWINQVGASYVIRRF